MARFRFAPSPTGLVHVGNLRTALFNYLLAKQAGNRLVLRIEDTDEERSKKSYEEGLICDLKWAGIEWDEGPDTGGEYGPYRQSERKALYLEYAQKLIESGHAYYCFCSKQENDEPSESKDKAGYPGTCRNLDGDSSQRRVEQGEAAAIRFKIPQDDVVSFKDIVRKKVRFDTNLLSDPIIVRSSGVSAYNFSVVVDDHLMKIDTVIRGEDHLSNTARQVLIYRALGLESPEFAHLSMVMGADNTKLSKRHGSVSVSEFRLNGYLPEAIFNYLALLGWSPKDNQEIFTQQELIDLFSLEKVSKSAAIFDYQKLKWINREHIRKLSSSCLADTLRPYLTGIGFEANSSESIDNWVAQAANVLSNYHQLLGDIAHGFKQFSSLDIDDEKRAYLETDDVKAVIQMFFDRISQLDSPIGFDQVGKITKEIQSSLGVKGKALYHPIRVALTGMDRGIELHDLIPIIETGSQLSIKPKIMNMVDRIRSLGIL